MNENREWDLEKYNLCITNLIEKISLINNSKINILNVTIDDLLLIYSALDFYHRFPKVITDFLIENKKD